MPWRESGPVDERTRLIEAHESGLYTMTEVCDSFGVSRKTGYKWLGRYRAGGRAALGDRSRAPLHSPQRMDEAIERLLLEVRSARPRWGPRKILAYLAREQPELAGRLPAASTAGDLFKRKGLVKERRRRRARAFDPAGVLETGAPNEIWTADYKGEFRMKNGRYCYPLTLVDAHSRFLLACDAQASTSVAGARKGCLEAFRAYGLPQAIRTDNGTPFAGHGQSGLSQLSVWWIKLGIRPQRIPKGRPDQNGAHERMHRTLAEETARPPANDLRRQQARFDDFRRDFNDERPHEALEQQTPASHYHSSVRAYPARLRAPEYPGHFERRTVDQSGSFKFRGLRRFIAQPLAGELLGFVETGTDLWSIRFYGHELGRMNPPQGKMFIKVLPMSPV